MLLASVYKLQTEPQRLVERSYATEIKQKAYSKKSLPFKYAFVCYLKQMNWSASLSVLDMRHYKSTSDLHLLWYETFPLNYLSAASMGALLWEAATFVLKTDLTTLWESR